MGHVKHLPREFGRVTKRALLVSLASVIFVGSLPFLIAWAFFAWVLVGLAVPSISVEGFGDDGQTKRMVVREEDSGLLDSAYLETFKATRAEAESIAKALGLDYVQSSKKRWCRTAFKGGLWWERGMNETGICYSAGDMSEYLFYSPKSEWVTHVMIAF